MSDLIELREKQAAALAKAREAFDQIKDDTSESRAKELEQQYDGYMGEYDALEAKIQRAEKLAAAEERANAPDPRRPVGTNIEGRREEPKAPEYGEVFEKALRYGVSELNAEERSVLMRNRDPEARAQSTGTDSAGGYTVPEGFVTELDKALALWGPMWDGGIVRELNTSSGNPLPWPTVDDTSKTGEQHTENGAATDDGGADVAFGQKMLNAYIYDTEVVRVPIELLQDSAFNMESLLSDLFGERLGRLANQVLTTGTGTNQPNGIVTASTVGKTAAAAAALDADELLDLFHSVDPAYRASPKCRWMFNDSTLAAIRKLKDGNGNYLWQMGDVRVGEPSTFLGKPYSVNQAMANIGASAKPIIFGDLSRYVVRKVRGFSVMTLRERYAENFQIGMIGFKRFDGELLNTAAVKHLAMAAA